LHTGDIASIDARGMMVIRDRVKDVIKTGGEWVSSLAIESIISKDPAVGEVAVIAVPDKKWGERPLALVVPAAGQTVDTAALHQRLQAAAAAGQISKYGVPDKILMVKELAKTSVGKLDKKLLRKTYAGAA
ncbi:MAG TPA: fatty acid--CoA ligase, partial [Nevskiaceae bacterium]|nr:fatty acid--CoA ligase [Nevskiaceae bacterium]